MGWNASVTAGVLGTGRIQYGFDRISQPVRCDASPFWSELRVAHVGDRERCLWVRSLDYHAASNDTAPGEGCRKSLSVWIVRCSMKSSSRVATTLIGGVAALFEEFKRFDASAETLAPWVNRLAAAADFLSGFVKNSRVGGSLWESVAQGTSTVVAAAKGCAAGMKQGGGPATRIGLCVFGGFAGEEAVDLVFSTNPLDLLDPGWHPSLPEWYRQEPMYPWDEWW